MGEVYQTVLKEDLIKPPKVMIIPSGIIVIFTQSVNCQTYINQAIKCSRLKKFADYIYRPAKLHFKVFNYCIEKFGNQLSCIMADPFARSVSNRNHLGDHGAES